MNDLTITPRAETVRRRSAHDVLVGLEGTVAQAARRDDWE